MLLYLHEELKKIDAAVAGVAIATAEQTTTDFIGPCFFADRLGQRYRIDTDEALSSEIQQTLATAFAVIPNQPDWAGFSDAIPQDILGEIATTALSSMIVSRLTRLADGAVEWEGSDDRLLTLWNQSPPSLNGDQRAELTQVAADHSVPLAIDESNIISTT